MADSNSIQIKNQQWINRVWYGRSLVSILLLPLSGLYWLLISTRKAFYNSFLFSKKQFERPVVVVGNITVGGTGKTPMVIYLCEQLKKLGYQPGVASRGYGGSVRSATLVSNAHDAKQVGDEAILIFKRTHCPVMIGSNRVEVINALIVQKQCNIVICDDGLQDYRFIHDVEIVMIDGDRQFGNTRLLPAGPLRESIGKIFKSDFCVATGQSCPDISADTMLLQTHELYALNDVTKTLELDTLRGETVHAVAGIANPQRFFDTLAAQGLSVIPHAHKDHAELVSQDLQFPDDYPVLITEKDAVKCTHFDLENVWVLPVSVQLPVDFTGRVQQLLRNCHG